MGVVDSDLSSFLVFGPSGSGVHTALKAFRELGFPVFSGITLPKAVSYLDESPVVLNPALDPYAVTPQDTKLAFENLKRSYPDLKLLYLSAPSETLISRYVAAEKKHPFDKTGLHDAVEAEQLLYQVLKPLSDYHIDTSTTTDRELGLKIAKILNIQTVPEPMTVTLTSFGFKHGLPQQADLVFDMRFLPNPFYNESLRPLTGLDKPVQEFLFAIPETNQFLTHWQNLLAHVLPMYQKEGKTRLEIAIGCTGGQHRSVALTQALATFLQSTFPDFNIKTVHREQHHWPQECRS